MLNSAMPKKVTVFDSNQQSSIPQDVRFLSTKNFQGNLDVHQTVWMQLNFFFKDLFMSYFKSLDIFNETEIKMYQTYP